MRRRRLLALGTATAVAGCSGSFGGERRGRLDLVVQNDRAEPVTVQVAVVDAEGLNYAFEETRIDAGVSEVFEVTVGAHDRHEATVSGGDWRGRLAWTVDSCRRFRGTVRVTEETVEVVSECVQR
jgi:hypothetical protein